MSNPLVPRSARFPRIQFLTALMAAAFFLSHQSGMAATRAWNVASGDWNLNTNWSPATVPVAADLVRIDNGGLVNVTDSQVATTVESGVFAGVNNRLVIASTGTLTTTGESSIGYSGGGFSGSVTVDGKWARGAGITYVGRGNGANGTILVQNGGVVTSTGGARVGEFGAASLTINSGGSWSDSYLALGNNGANSNGSATVSGAGSTMTLSSFLTVGNTGTGSFTVGTGVVVSSVGLTGVGSNGGTGTVLVRGTMSNTGNWTFGLAGGSTGMLTIGAGGVVNANSGAGTINLGWVSSGAQVLNIGGVVNGVTPGTAEAAGVLNAVSVDGYSVNSVVNFNHTDANYYFTKTGLAGGTAIQLKFSADVGVYSGTTSLTAANTNNGATTVTGGTLILAGAGHLNSSAVTVGAGGGFVQNSSVARTGAITLNGVDASNRAILGGTGQINVTGGITLDNIGDTLSPGNSPGIQNFATAQTWNSFTYLWETNNWTGTTAGTDFDRITITGGLTLTGGNGAYGLDLHSLTALNAAGNVPNFSEVDTSWTILTATGGITGFNAANWTITESSFTTSPTRLGAFSLSQSGNNLVLDYVVPEPGTAALLVFSLTTLMVMRRRRQS